VVSTTVFGAITTFHPRQGIAAMSGCFNIRGDAYRISSRLAVSEDLVIFSNTSQAPFGMCLRGSQKEQMVLLSAKAASGKQTLPAPETGGLLINHNFHLATFSS